MADLEFSWLDALCRAAATNLPRGARGVEAAQLFLAAFPEACRRGLGDTTDSAPGHFGALVRLGVLPGLPGESAMTAAIRLIAATTDLLTPRSPRRWTAWYGSARDLDAPLGARLRAQVTPAMMLAPTPSPSPIRRRESIQRERDRLAAELAAARQDLAAATNDRDRRLAAAASERDRLAADLATAANDRDHLTSELTAARNALAAAVNDRDQLTADLGATRADLTAARARHDDLASQHADLTTDRARLADELQRARKVLARAQRDLAATQEALTLTTHERSDRAEALHRAESERDDIAAQLARSIADRDALAESLATRIDEATAQTKSLQLATRTNETLTAKVDLLTTEKRAAEDDLRRAHAAQRQTEADAKQLRRDVEELSNTVSHIRNALAIPDRDAETLLVVSNIILDRIQRLRESNRQLAGQCHLKNTDLACAELRIEILKVKAGNPRIEDEYERRLPECLARAKSQAYTMLAPLLAFT